MPPVLIRYWPAGCVHSEFWLGLGGAFVCGWGEFWTSNYPLHLPSFFGNTERDDKESRHDMLNMLKSETRQVPPNHITPVHPSKTLTWNLKDDAPKKRRWIELGHHHHVLQLFWCLMLKFEGLLVRFSHYLLTLSSFLQRLGALNARPEGLFWNFVCTWISFVGISANLHVFFSMFFFQLSQSQLSNETRWSNFDAKSLEKNSPSNHGKGGLFHFASESEKKPEVSSWWLGAWRISSWPRLRGDFLLEEIDEEKSAPQSPITFLFQII